MVHGSGRELVLVEAPGFCEEKSNAGQRVNCDGTRGAKPVVDTAHAIMEVLDSDS